MLSEAAAEMLLLRSKLNQFIDLVTFPVLVSGLIALIISVRITLIFLMKLVNEYFCFCWKIRLGKLCFWDKCIHWFSQK